MSRLTLYECVVNVCIQRSFLIQLQDFFSKHYTATRAIIVWFQKISIPPPPDGRDLPYDPPPLWIFQNRPPKFPPPPCPPKLFAHPLEILLSLIEVNKEVVLFTRMPNFVSSMYFLLNCITDKRILGLHVTSPKIKLRNYRFLWVSTFTRYYST